MMSANHMREILCQSIGMEDNFFKIKICKKK